MSEHMPGPWKAVRCEHGWHIGPQPAGACSIHDDTDSSGYARQEANAHLIAAAPNLLAACEAIVLAMRQNDPALGAVAATLAEAAIEKTRR